MYYQSVDSTAEKKQPKMQSSTAFALLMLQDFEVLSVGESDRDSSIQKALFLFATDNKIFIFSGRSREVQQQQPDGGGGEPTSCEGADGVLRWRDVDQQQPRE